MAKCETCGNLYEGGLEMLVEGKSMSFDCFECAIHRLAPRCESCNCRILGHGVQAETKLFCSSHCARSQGIHGTQTHV